MVRGWACAEPQPQHERVEGKHLFIDLIIVENDRTSRWDDARKVCMSFP